MLWVAKGFAKQTPYPVGKSQNRAWGEESSSFGLRVILLKILDAGGFLNI